LVDLSYNLKNALHLLQIYQPKQDSGHRTDLAGEKRRLWPFSGEKEGERAMRSIAADMT
jgi:hypothetical protein